MSHHHACCQDEVMARMTPNRQTVLAILQQSGRALSAYELLDRLRAQGVHWQPPTAYRALDFLVDHGVVHYLQSIQKYVVCPHQGCDHFSQLLICVECGQVEEVPLGAALEQLLAAQVHSHGFQLSPQFLELKGRCHHCQQQDDHSPEPVNPVN